MEEDKMPYFPAFIDLKGEQVLVIGGGHVAAEKVERLLPYGPQVTAIAPQFVPLLQSLGRNSDQNSYKDGNAACGQVRLLHREFRKEDITSGEGLPVLVIAATDDHALNAQISEICQKARILCNAVDEKELCSFIFPSLVRKGELSIGISSGGASPAAAIWCRKKIEKEIPDEMGPIIEYLGSVRGEVLRRLSGAENAGKRHRAFALLFSACMEAGRGLHRDEFEQVLLEVCAEGEDSSDTAEERGEETEGNASDGSDQQADGRKIADAERGSVTIVGAGCGRGLLTLAGAEALSHADEVLYDDLADPGCLRNISPQCETFYVGKRGGKKSTPQQEINDLMIRLAGEGKNVVRLKGGDPYVFGRGAEEVMALHSAGIHVEVIPGVTSAVAVPEHLGIPVTLRGTARSFTVVTGHTGAVPAELHTAGVLPVKDTAENGERVSSGSSANENTDDGALNVGAEENAGENYRALAQLDGTLVFLMGVKEAGHIAEQLMRSGKDAETPCAILSCGFSPEEERCSCTLGTLGECAKDAKTPAVIVIGETAGMDLR